MMVSLLSKKIFEVVGQIVFFEIMKSLKEMIESGDKWLSVISHFLHQLEEFLKLQSVFRDDGNFCDDLMNVNDGLISLLGK